MKKYINPVPVVLTDEQEAQFYQPITDLLNQLSEDAQIKPSTDYFKLLVELDRFVSVITKFNLIGVRFENAAGVMKDSPLLMELDAREAFEDFVTRKRREFLNQLREGQDEIPEYLENRELQDYCADCRHRSCLGKDPHCTRLYMTEKPKERTD